MKVKCTYLTGGCKEVVRTYVLAKLASYLKGKEDEVRVYWERDPYYPEDGKVFRIKGRTERSVLQAETALHSLINECYDILEGGRN